MWNQLLHLDQELFFTINQSHLYWLDSIMPYFRHKIFWAPLYIFIVTFLIWNFPRNGLLIILFTVLTVGLSDTASSQWVKKTVQRSRPCNDELIRDQVVLRIRCGGGYSFTSSHATNHAALAFFLFFLFRDESRVWRYLLLFWAFTVGMAQIYVGVHYPLDVLGGLILGGTIGTVLAYLYLRFFKLE